MIYFILKNIHIDYNDDILLFSELIFILFNVFLFLQIFPANLLPVFQRIHFYSFEVAKKYAYIEIGPKLKDS